MYVHARNSLIRISALGVDGGAWSSFLEVCGGVLFPFSGLQDQGNVIYYIDSSF